jgi:hypothetical protein
MKKFLTALALTATMISFPAFADPGCDPGNSLNNTQVSDCNERFAYNRMGSTVIAPMPFYYGAESFAYVPSRPLVIQRGRFYRSNSSLDEETRVKGGSD